MKINGDDIIKAVIVSLLIGVGIIALPIIIVIGSVLLPLLLPVCIIVGICVLIGVAIGKGGDSEQKK